MFPISPSKRRKYTGNEQTPLPGISTSTSTSTPSHEWLQCSPSTGAGSTGWYQDGFSHDPAYLASQEELRCMLFSIAESGEYGARGGSPDGKSSLSPLGVMNNAVSNGRRIKYLKNYVGEVAPWVNLQALQYIDSANYSVAGHVRYPMLFPYSASRVGSQLPRAAVCNPSHFSSSDGAKGGYPGFI